MIRVDFDLDRLAYDRDGLVPVILQDAQTYAVLTLAYANREAVARTMETGETWLFSRSRNELWHKGTSSGNRQTVLSIHRDCDHDALLYRVSPHGPACHTGAYSCFEGVAKSQAAYGVLAALEALIDQRYRERPEGAYTTYLFEKGVDKILKKLGEETSEVILAVKNDDPTEIRYEAADLLYHLFVMLRHTGIPLSAVLEELSTRYERPRKTE
ncbi:bifunctional phosphoribosyl-AMP cyclohydrolase/phosphoribosyl-ATP diphosphatase HisIE [Ferroacidibacillus organovorans]|uniref:Histidine biosynthesis bifunctional protein HisIE n=1 Tax=Ferroacidibacillus organovorans TaxID=1765683 RepID=A0A162SV32_9BACL|nr:bifunctional phosphoribosyl-AMP cyclohydrolase/phosphoribosyl-ATP diphosphatase HisIE [Ferroacidibacillus organovorans]KYP80178.1 bifunctional phosphoribosyl-AMP cyclohydrolase/phosphoribosyl-ATP pyrophosphatase [Ferroacidibacillus organovorans]OAG95055.1 bifunctional phosphoribosyl-AMP cyclohydrolase/phosphoribosyl-ATP pyrophosphatase [Ferroacidibacillus organovorans]OPG17625.1 bifunctional phosphoribosyl-AMP cyclohydrolase/phosphoribosyl-ATP pyrophosphatase [Ferroacidibacillus organovorans]